MNDILAKAKLALFRPFYLRHIKSRQSSLDTSRQFVLDQKRMYWSNHFGRLLLPIHNNLFFVSVNLFFPLAYYGILHSASGTVNVTYYEKISFVDLGVK
jgi:hypothetical protein